MSRINALPQLDSSNYPRSLLHAESCTWLEKNCYVDIWIEVLHALGVEPRAMLPFTVAIDFEGDQWTFFKPLHSELFDLYGVDVQELNVWKPLVEHAVEHLAAGRLISTESDAFWLPDTSGTDYRRQHTKSTIVLADIDVDARKLGYFHNAGYFMLEGEDFARTFRLDMEPDPTFMPLFAETVRFERLVRRTPAELADMSRALWRRHLARVPANNPIPRFQRRFEDELTLIQQRGLAFYHAWAFATTRQLGAAFELGAANLRWMRELGQVGLDEPIGACELIATTSKSFILKGARAVNSRKPFDGAAMFGELASTWERGVAGLQKVFG